MDIEKVKTGQFAKENPDTTVKETVRDEPKETIEVLRNWKNVPFPVLESAINDVLEYFDANL